jgi:hypothetical protein
VQDIKALSVLARCSGSASTRTDSQRSVLVEVYPQRHKKNITSLDLFRKQPSQASEAPANDSKFALSSGREELAATPQRDWQDLKAPQEGFDTYVAASPAKSRRKHRRVSRQEKAAAMRRAESVKSADASVQPAPDHAEQTGAPASHQTNDEPPTGPPTQIAQGPPLIGGAALPWQNAIPQFTLPSISAAVNSVQTALPRLPIRLPFLLSALQSRDNVTVDETADVLASYLEVSPSSGNSMSPERCAYWICSHLLLRKASKYTCSGSARCRVMFCQFIRLWHFIYSQRY